MIALVFQVNVLIEGRHGGLPLRMAIDYVRVLPAAPGKKPPERAQQAAPLHFTVLSTLRSRKRTKPRLYEPPICHSERSEESPAESVVFGQLVSCPYGAVGVLSWEFVYITFEFISKILRKNYK